jgi:Beta/Gamma crystallin
VVTLSARARPSAANFAAAVMLAVIAGVASVAPAQAAHQGRTVMAQAQHGGALHHAVPVFRPAPVQYGAPHPGNAGRPVHVAPAFTPSQQHSFPVNPEFHRVNPGLPPNNPGATRPNLPLNGPSALRPNFPAYTPSVQSPLAGNPAAAQGASPSQGTAPQPAAGQPAIVHPSASAPPASQPPASQPVMLKPLSKAPAAGVAPAKPAFPAVRAHDRFWPLHKDSRFVWLHGQRRLFTPIALLGVVLIGDAYWYPDAYVSAEGPACTGYTADGCQLQYRMVDLEDGGAEPQCVQYCPQTGPPPQQVATLPPPPAPVPDGGTCQTTIYSEPNFHGNSAPTGDRQPVLSPTGWQNEIQSIVIRAGTWDFFADENFGGESLRLGPGTYPMLAPEWTRRIGSFMCVEPGLPPA